MNYDSYIVLGYGAHALLDNGKVRLYDVDAIPMKNGGWRYLWPNNRFVAPGPLREEVTQALATAGPGHTEYHLSTQHAIVLYPDFITLDDLRAMRVVEGNLDKAVYGISAELPFAEGRTSRVDVIINTNQVVPLIVKE